MLSSISGPRPTCTFSCSMHAAVSHQHSPIFAEGASLPRHLCIHFIQQFCKWPLFTIGYHHKTSYINRTSRPSKGVTFHTGYHTIRILLTFNTAVGTNPPNICMHHISTRYLHYIHYTGPKPHKKEKMQSIIIGSQPLAMIRAPGKLPHFSVCVPSPCIMKGRTATHALRKR